MHRPLIASLSPRRWWRAMLAVALVAGLALGGRIATAADTPGLAAFPIPSGGQPRSFTAGPDGNVWFVESKFGQPTTYTFAKVTPDGTVTEYPQADPRTAIGDMAGGADGNVWFLAPGANTVGRITPAGAISAYDVPTAASGLGSITRGPDGNVWFTEGTAHKVAKITPAGAITEYPVSDRPALIVSGPQGALWFSLPGKLGRITPNGAESEVALSRPVNGDVMLVAPDGTFWFAYYVSCSPHDPRTVPCDDLFQVSQAGAVSVYRNPGGLHHGTVGPDGSLWLTLGDGDVSRITADGMIARYTVLDLASNTLAFGADGNLWFGGYMTNGNVGTPVVMRLDPRVAVPSGPATPLQPDTPAATQPAPATAAPAAASAPSCSDITPNAPVALQPFRDQYQAGEALAPNFWGPAFTDFAPDMYDGHTRLVQYFDKGRMELTGTTVTSGLLATELITGQIQRGDATFDAKPAPQIPIAGDPDGGGLTYATLGTTAAALLANAPTSRLGVPITTTVSAAGMIDPGTPGPFGTGPTVIGNYDFPTQHNVANAFAAYRTTVGLQTIGYAKSEPFWTTVKVAGQQRQVLVQVFERRVLTYTATNPDPFKVEMGNIGQHYFRWRYCSG